MTSGQFLDRALRSAEASSVMMILGPKSGPLPKKAFTGRMDLNRELAASIVSSFSLDVSILPSGRPPAGEGHTK